MTASVISASLIGVQEGDAAPLTVLHVDDDMAALIMAEAALEDAGFNVVQASNGEEAVARYQEHTPDLIVMDAVMPVMDGFDAIAEIRGLPGGAHVPILMITGLDDLDSITRAYDEGATDFLTKPINFFILPHRVQYMLRSKATADALRASEAKLDNAQRMARMGHWEWAIESGELTVSHGFRRTMPGLEARSSVMWTDVLQQATEAERFSIEQTASKAVQASEAFTVEFAVETDDNARILVIDAEPHCDADGRCTHMLGTIQDVTERRAAQTQIHNLAYFDIITGLPNRAKLLERLDEALERGQHDDSRFAVLFVDLDHFKQVNDTLGHDAGDTLLRQVAARIQSVLRDTDMVSSSANGLREHTVARLGGDEFVVLLDGIRRPEDSARVAQRIAATIRAPFDLEGIEVKVSSTIGISVYPSDGNDGTSLLKHADIAMYHAKERGRDGYQFYSRAIHKKALTRFALEKDLKQAIENDDLELVFQPKIDIGTGRISGCEALVRWSHPERGPISPVEFIPLAEETGLILPLGQCVLHRACHQMQLWQDRGEADFGIAVNCSAVQFTRGNMDRELDDVLTSSGLCPSLLEVELTESLLMQDIEAGIASLKQMKSLGVQVSIDDFGTGFSSLSYLKRLPADKLKIDRCFVTDLVTDTGDAAIVTAVTRLSHDLGLTVVAEGVETREQLAALDALGCDEAQGYLFSKPLSAPDFIAWVAAQRKAEAPNWLDRAA